LAGTNNLAYLAPPLETKKKVLNAEIRYYTITILGWIIDICF
jgi:hypothetical protein